MRSFLTGAGHRHRHRGGDPADLHRRRAASVCAGRILPVRHQYHHDPAGQVADPGRQRRHFRLGQAADAGGCRCVAPSAICGACQPRPDGQCRGARQRQDRRTMVLGEGRDFRKAFTMKVQSGSFWHGRRRRTGARAGRARLEGAAGTVRRTESAGQLSAHRRRSATASSA